MVDYTPHPWWQAAPPGYPTLCIRSLVEYKPGYYYLDMPSWYDSSLEPYPLEVDQETVDIIKNHFNVVMCPPGWPYPPESDLNNTETSGQPSR